jgi:hypothetical protein
VQLRFWKPKFAMQRNKNKLADLRSSAEHAHLCLLILGRKKERRKKKEKKI